MYCKKWQDTYSISFNTEIEFQSYKYTVSLIKVQGYG